MSLDDGSYDCICGSGYTGNGRPCIGKLVHRGLNK